MDWNELGRIAPEKLSTARIVSHEAVQWPSRAARANVEALADDSHSNLGWDSEQGALLSHDLREGNGTSLHVGVEIGGLRLLFLEGGERSGTFELAGRTHADAGAWLDGQLADAGLRAASMVELPYTLPEETAGGTAHDSDSLSNALAELGRWYEAAHVSLQEVAAELGSQASPVRCWPHHFDIATLVSLEEGDAETARSIGMGLSPGDESHAEPYFYVNPWPHLKPDALPPLPFGHWHVEGYVGAIATASGILALSNRREQLTGFLREAFAIGKRELGL